MHRPYCFLSAGFMSGSSAATMPSRGRSVLTRNTNCMSVISASHPKKAAPMPPRPNDRPKNSPAMVPICAGLSSVAKTSMAENADEITRPTITDSAIVTAYPAYGRHKAKGAAPRIEHQMTYLRPILSPMYPPATMPMADAARNANKHSWASRTCR